MATVAEFIDDLRDRLNDVSDTQVPFATKVRFLNRGQYAMFPKVYNVARDTTLTIASSTFEYTIPATVGAGKILTVEVETASASNRYVPINRYDIIPSLTTPTLVFMDSTLPGATGSRIRITAANRLTAFTSASYAAAGAEQYSGPVGTEELPVLYAMGLSTARILDDRMDYTRYSVTQQNNAVDSNDIMQVSQFWFAQFELLLERMMMPLPVSTR